MTTHALIEYLKYKWKAKGRHGIHSPFVYDLIAHVLHDKGPIERAYIVDLPNLPLRYENLVSRITAYYKYKAILFLPIENEPAAPQQADMLLLNETAPLQWMGLVDKYSYLLNNDSAIAVMGIHKTPAHTMEWGKLCAGDKVRMSIDLYSIGLLFFKQEFKEQQHFILKYH